MTVDMNDASVGLTAWLRRVMIPTDRFSEGCDNDLQTRPDAAVSGMARRGRAETPKPFSTRAPTVAICEHS